MFQENNIILCKVPQNNICRSILTYYFDILVFWKIRYKFILTYVNAKKAKPVYLHLCV
jgi:hypothetical protein